MAKVLIIDDSREDRELMKSQALAAGASACVSFPSVEAAESHLESNTTDVILLDYVLENEVGLARIPALRHMAPDARIVLVTGRYVETMSKLAEKFADGFISKEDLVEEGEEILKEMLAV